VRRPLLFPTYHGVERVAFVISGVISEHVKYFDTLKSNILCSCNTSAFYILFMLRKKKKGPMPGTLYKNVQRTQLGTKIAALRHKRGLTQQDLGNIAGLSKRMVSYYERDSETIPANQIQKIAQALNVPIDELINYQPDTNVFEVNRTFLKRLELAKTLAPKDQKIISDMIDSLIEKKHN
jgi:transcriptional regulator with XRE-family HTH domain